MYFEIIGEIESIETIATGGRILSFLSPRPRPYGRAERSAFKADFSTPSAALTTVEMTDVSLCRFSNNLDIHLNLMAWVERS